MWDQIRNFPVTFTEEILNGKLNFLCSVIGLWCFGKSRVMLFWESYFFQFRIKTKILWQCWLSQVRYFGKVLWINFLTWFLNLVYHISSNERQILNKHCLLISAAPLSSHTETCVPPNNRHSSIKRRTS